jgi:hypothetical protein
MARLNTLNLNTAPRTHEGTPARHVSPEMQLRRSVLNIRPTLLARLPAAFAKMASPFP